MTIYCVKSDPPELATVLSRIRKKKKDYQKYDFSIIQGRTLRAFFDLAQEYETLENFYRVAVFVPKIFMDFDTCLYLVDFKSGRLKMAFDSLNAFGVCGMDPPEGVALSPEPYEKGDSFFAPIRGNKRLLAAKNLANAQDLIGIFEVFPRGLLNEKDKLFFEKYANRIGYNLHYKLLARQNEQHIRFINTLVEDIEHNVIVPNIKYKVFLNLIRSNIRHLSEISRNLDRHLADARECNCSRIVSAEDSARNLEKTIEGLSGCYRNMEKHFNNTSLFLESLLRREHFQKGELVLKRGMCNFRKEVIEPQIDRFRDRLERRGIKIDNQLGGVPDEDIPLAVDIGLISQVYANLFSNAEKYCQEVTDESGRKWKFMAYGREIIPDYYGPGYNGVKFNVFTTGPHIPIEEAPHVFDEGFRATSTAKRPGTGHGLHFVKKIIEVHGGTAGYEPASLGNNFYFILPLKEAILKEGEMDK